jgi:hypothetical protein
MLATRCTCGFEALADEEVTDHLQAMFEPEDCVGTDGWPHLEGAAQVCSCGYSAATTAELDAHFLAVFTPAGSVGRDGEKHEATELR